eukprot:7101110-Alexandrium_andersonii.AAC.1
MPQCIVGCVAVPHPVWLALRRRPAPTDCSPTPWVRTRSTQPRCVCDASGALPPFPPLRTPSPR